ncbi:hypothetical protein GC177_04895 [bacterium]|nr:hypothetical protein [bacterium]
MTEKRLDIETLAEIRAAAHRLRDGNFNGRKFVARMNPRYSNIQELERAIGYAVMESAMVELRVPQGKRLAFGTAYQEGKGIHECVGIALGDRSKHQLSQRAHETLAKLDDWLERHQSSLLDLRNPEGWLRDLQQEFGITMRESAFRYALEDEYQALLTNYGEEELGFKLSQCLNAVITSLSPEHQELLYTYLLEPTYVDVDNSILRHQDVQDNLNRLLIRTADNMGGPGIVDTNLTAGKSEESLYYKLHNGKPDTSRAYRDTEEFLGQLVKKCGDLSTDHRVVFSDKTLWDVLNHFYRHHTGHGLVRPFYPNFVRDGARATLLPHSPDKLYEVLNKLANRDLSNIIPRENYGWLDAENGMIYPAGWLRSIFPEQRVSMGGFSNGVEVRRSGLVFGTFMIPFDADGKHDTPDDTVVAEVQVMSPNMQVAKHWEDTLYKAKTHIDKSTPEGAAAHQALAQLGLTYYLTAMNADVALNPSWGNFYLDAFFRTANDLGDIRYQLTPDAGASFLEHASTPNGNVTFLPEWLYELPQGALLDEKSPPTFLRLMEGIALGALRQLPDHVQEDALVSHCAAMFAQHGSDISAAA